jgi:hypothetical protein
MTTCPALLRGVLEVVADQVVDLPADRLPVRLAGLEELGAKRHPSHLDLGPVSLDTLMHPPAIQLVLDTGARPGTPRPTTSAGYRRPLRQAQVVESDAQRFVGT